MNTSRLLHLVRRGFGRGVFPAQFSWMLELRARRLLLSPPRLAERRGLDEAMAILEVGAGSGFYSTEVAQQMASGHLFITDLQPAMLARCRANADIDERTHVHFIACDGTRLPFCDASFDLVYMVTVFGELHDAAAGVSEIRRVLKPGGALSISEHLPDPDFVTLASLRRRVERLGFAVVRVDGPWWAYTATFARDASPDAASDPPEP